MGKCPRGVVKGQRGQRAQGFELRQDIQPGAQVRSNLPLPPFQGRQDMKVPQYQGLNDSVRQLGETQVGQIQSPPQPCQLLVGLMAADGKLLLQGNEAGADTGQASISESISANRCSCFSPESICRNI